MMFFRPEVYQLRLKFRAMQALTLAVTVSLSSQVPAATSALINVQEQPDTVTAKAFNSFAAPYQIDYQRLSENQEMLQIALDNPDTQIEIKRQGNTLLVRLKGVTASSAHGSMPVLGQKLTGLLQRIEADQRGKDTWLIFTVSKDFEYQSYQLDNLIKIQIQPVRAIQQNTVTPKIYSGKPISVDFQQVEVRSVLHLLSQFTDTNIVATDQVTGSLMLNLVNVPWDQALDIILTSQQLGKQTQGNVILVAPLAQMAKQRAQQLAIEQQSQALMPLRSEYIRLNYAKAADLQALIIKASGSPTPTPVAMQHLPASTAVANAPSALPAVVTRLNLPVSSRLLSSRGVIAVDARTNTLIIKDTADSLSNIHALIKQIDIPVRQVMIEVRMVSATDNFSKEMGVKWGLLSKGVAHNDDLLVGASDQTLADLKSFSAPNTAYKGRNKSRAGYAITRPDNLNVDLGISNPAGRIAFGLLSMSDLMIDLELSAMQAEGRGEVISTPKILTLDKQTATVSSGTKIPYQSESEGGGTTTQFEEALLSLQVTPSITPEDKISLQLNIENGRPNPVGNGVILIDTDRLSTRVTVGDGQTLVLGGIYRNQIFNNTQKVPFFGDLPYIGRLFKQDLRRNDQQELLIFVTPKLMQLP